MRAFREEGVTSSSASSRSQPCPELPQGFLAGLFARGKKQLRSERHAAEKADEKATALRLVDGLITSVASAQLPPASAPTRSSPASGSQDTAGGHEEVSLRCAPGSSLPSIDDTGMAGAEHGQRVNAMDEVTLHSPSVKESDAAVGRTSGPDDEVHLPVRDFADTFAIAESTAGSAPRTNKEQPAGAQSPRATLRREGGSTGALPTMEAVTPIEPSATSPGSSELSPPWPSSVSAGTVAEVASRDAGRKSAALDPSQLSSSTSGFDNTQDMLRGALLDSEESATAGAAEAKTAATETFACSSSSDLSNVVADTEAVPQNRGSGSSVETQSAVAADRASDVEVKARATRSVATTGSTGTTEALAGTTRSQATAATLVDGLLSSFTGRRKSPDTNKVRSAGVEDQGDIRISGQHDAGLGASASRQADSAASRSPMPAATDGEERQRQAMESLLGASTSGTLADALSGLKHSNDDADTGEALPKEATRGTSSGTNASVEDIVSPLRATTADSEQHQREDGDNICASASPDTSPDIVSPPMLRNTDDAQCQRKKSIESSTVRPDSAAIMPSAPAPLEKKADRCQKTVRAQRRLATEGLVACLQRATQNSLLHAGLEALWSWTESERSRAAVHALQERLDRKGSAQRRVDAEIQVDATPHHHADGAAGDTAGTGPAPNASAARLDVLEGRIEALMQLEKHREERTAKAMVDVVDAVVSQQAELVQQSTLSAGVLKDTARRLEVLSTQMESVAASPSASRPVEIMVPSPVQPSHAAAPLPPVPVRPDCSPGPADRSAGGRARPSSANATVGRRMPSLLAGGPDSAGGVSPTELRRDWETLAEKKESPIKKNEVPAKKQSPVEAGVMVTKSDEQAAAPTGGDEGAAPVSATAASSDGVRHEHLAACGVLRARLAPLLDPPIAAQKALVLERLKAVVGEHYAVLCMQSKVRCFQARRVLCFLQRHARPRSRRSRSHGRGHAAAAQSTSMQWPPDQSSVLVQGEVDSMQRTRPRSASFENMHNVRPHSASFENLQLTRPRSASSVASSSGTPSSSYFRRRFYAIEEQAHAGMVQPDGIPLADTPVSSSSSHPLALMDGGLSGLPSELLQYAQPRSRPSSSSRPRVRSAARSRPSVSSDGSRPSVVPPLALERVQLDKTGDPSEISEKASVLEATTLHPDQLALARMQMGQVPMLGSTLPWRPSPEDLDQFVAQRLQGRSSAQRVDRGQEAVYDQIDYQGQPLRAGRGLCHEGTTHSAPAARRGTAMAAASRRHGQRQHPGLGRAHPQQAGAPPSPSISLPTAGPGDRRSVPAYLPAGARQRVWPQKSPMNMKGSSPKAQRSASAGAAGFPNSPNEGGGGGKMRPVTASGAGGMLPEGSGGGRLRPVTAKASPGAQQKSPPGRSSSTPSSRMPRSALVGSRLAPPSQVHQAEQLLAATRAATAYEWPPMSGAAFGLRPKSAPNGAGGHAFAIARGNYAECASPSQKALPAPVVDPVAAVLGGSSTLSLAES